MPLLSAQMALAHIAALSSEQHGCGGEEGGGGENQGGFFLYFFGGN